MNWAGVARGRLRLAWNTFLPPSRHGRSDTRPSRPWLGVTLALLLAALVCVTLAALFGQLAADGASPAEAGVALGLVLSAAVFGLLIFDLHEAVTTLTVDSDLELLRRAPISPPALFAFKLLDALPRTSLLLITLAIPAVVAYQAFFPLRIWAWPLVAALLLALWAIPLGVGAALAIHLLRWVPARHAREALGLVSSVTLFVLWLANSFLLPRLADTAGDPVAIFHGLLREGPGLFRWSPGQWTARAIAAAAAGSRDGPARPAALVFAAAALSLLGAALTAGKHLEVVQARIAAGVGPRRHRRRGIERSGGTPRPQEGAAHAGALAPSGPAPGRGVIAAIVLRDARLFRRDWTVLGDVLTAAVLWTLLPLVAAPLYEVSTRGLARVMLLALTIGLGYEVAARALPFERAGLVWTRLSPVSPSRVIAAKLIGCAAVSLPLLGIAAASMAVALQLGPGEVMGTLLVVVPALAVALSVGLWTGSVFGSPGWTNPRAMLTVTGRAMATLLLLAQAGGWLVLTTLAEAHRPSLPPGFLGWGPAVLAAVLSAPPLRAAARRLGSREWKEA